MKNVAIFWKCLIRRYLVQNTFKMISVVFSSDKNYFYIFIINFPFLKIYLHYKIDDIFQFVLILSINLWNNSNYIFLNLNSILYPWATAFFSFRNLPLPTLCGVSINTSTNIFTNKSKNLVPWSCHQNFWSPSVTFSFKSLLYFNDIWHLNLFAFSRFRTINNF